MNCYSKWSVQPIIKNKCSPIYLPEPIGLAESSNCLLHQPPLNWHNGSSECHSRLSDLLCQQYTLSCHADFTEDSKVHKIIVVLCFSTGCGCSALQQFAIIAFFLSPHLVASSDLLMLFWMYFNIIEINKTWKIQWQFTLASQGGASLYFSA